MDKYKESWMGRISPGFTKSAVGTKSTNLMGRGGGLHPERNAVRQNFATI